MSFHLWYNAIHTVQILNYHEYVSRLQRDPRRELKGKLEQIFDAGRRKGFLKIIELYLLNESMDRTSFRIATFFKLIFLFKNFREFLMF